jgi:hypothetical protein
MNKICFEKNIGDGYLELEEIKAIIRNSMDDNELYFTEDEIDKLSIVLFKKFDTDDSKSIDFNEFYNQLLTRPGLIENLSINVENWFLPTPEKEKRFHFNKLMPQRMTLPHILNNLVSVIFFLAFFVINVVLFITRALDFYDPINPNPY